MFEQHKCENPEPGPNFVKYEANKSAWMKANPDATPTEYQTAMQANAHECGF
jgi:hypothetical protein